MPRQVRRSLSFEGISFDLAAMYASHEQAAQVLMRDMIPLEDQSASVGPAALGMMGMIADLAQEPVGIGIGAIPGLTNVNSAGHDMKRMRNYASSEERLSVRIEIQPPRITGSFRKDLELPIFRLVAPYRGIELHLANLGLGEYAVQSVELAIGPPLQRIERLMSVLASESRQEDVTMIAPPCAFAISKKEQIWRRTEKHAAVPHFNAAGQIEMR